MAEEMPHAETKRLYAPWGKPEGRVKSAGFRLSPGVLGAIVLKRGQAQPNLGVP